MTITEKIRQIQELLSDETIGKKGRGFHFLRVQKILIEVAADFIDDKKMFFEYSGKLVEVLEQYYDVAFDHVFKIFLEQLNRIKSVNAITHGRKEDPVLNSTKTWVVPLLKSLTSQLNESDQLKKLENINLQIEDDKRRDLFQCLNQIIFDCITRRDCLNNNLSRIKRDLSLMHHLIESDADVDDFYLLVSECCQALRNNEQYESQRQLAQDALNLSFNDSCEEYGYYVMFKSFSTLGNPLLACLFGFLTLHTVERKNHASDKLLKRIFIQGLILARNSNYSAKAKEIFEMASKGLMHDFAENNMLHHAYYTTLINITEPLGAKFVLEFIESNKAELIAGHDGFIPPWLVLLFRIKLEFSLSKEDQAKIESQIELLKKHSSESSYKKYETGLFGTLDETKTLLTQSLIDLAKTINPSDFIGGDNKFALSISNLVLRKAFEQNDVAGYLLAMILKSDLSFVFQKKRDLSSVQETKKFEDKYDTPQKLIDAVNNFEGVQFLWLGTDGYNVLPMFYDGHSFSFPKTVDWSLVNTRKFIDQDLKKLSTEVDTQKSQSEHLIEDEQLKKEIQFASIPIETTMPLMIVKDMELGEFPHNLILKDDFILNKIPISNVVSLEWLIKRKSFTNFSHRFAIWIPEKTGDFAIAMTLDKIRPLLDEYEFIKHFDLVPSAPLQAKINFVVAHGSHEINKFSAFYMNENGATISTQDFSQIIGPGDVLILFVCHAGSMEKDFFRRQLLSLSKKFLQSGYKAVVAPFWALNTTIPPIWMPAFLKSLHEGDNLTTAVWKANMKVKEEFNTPKAYACLHVYGDAFYKM